MLAEPVPADVGVGVDMPLDMAVPAVTNSTSSLVRLIRWSDQGGGGDSGGGKKGGILMNE